MYIQDQNWESFEAPRVASWAVKIICKVRNQIKLICGSGWQNNTHYNKSAMYKLLHNPGLKLVGVGTYGLPIICQNIALLDG